MAGGTAKFRIPLLPRKERLKAYAIKHFYPSLKSKVSQPSIGVHQSGRGIVKIEAKLKRDVESPEWSPPKNGHS